MKLIIARLELKVEDFEVDPAIDLIRAAASGGGSDAKITVLPVDESFSAPSQPAPSTRNRLTALVAT